MEFCGWPTLSSNYLPLVSKIDFVCKIDDHIPEAGILDKQLSTNIFGSRD